MSVELGFLEFNLHDFRLNCNSIDREVDPTLWSICGQTVNNYRGLKTIQSDFQIIQESLNKEIPSNGGGIPTLPEGAGVEIGFALLALASVAFGIRFIARLILNR